MKPRLKWSWEARAWSFATPRCGLWHHDANGYGRACRKAAGHREGCK